MPVGLAIWTCEEEYGSRPRADKGFQATVPDLWNAIPASAHCYYGVADDHAKAVSQIPFRWSSG